MYLGLDIGTSAIKALLLDKDMSFVATASEPLSVSRPHEGWSEQDPQAWCHCVDKVMHALKQAAPIAVSEIASIGLSGQMHGLVALDAQNNVLRPAILWNDVRNGAEARELDESYPAFRKIAGNAVMPGFTAPKALWIARHEPEIFNKIATILLPKDYVRFWLSGEKYTDMSDCSGTLWLDVGKRAYDKTLLAHTGLSIDAMPSLAEGSQGAGILRADLAQEWGISGQPVLAGAGDNAAAACGLGVVKSGDGFVSLGTSGVVFVVTDDFAPSAANGVHAFCHALPERWHQMGVILSATDSLNWLSDVTDKSIAELVAAAANKQGHLSQLYFHPYLSGERTPHNDADARGGFFNLSRSHDIGDMAYAVLEGVAFALADCVDVMHEAGSHFNRLIATGGGAKNAQWLQMIADVTNVQIIRPIAGEFGAALGAARLGALASGRCDETILTQPESESCYQPSPENHLIYQTRRQRWQRLYHLIREEQ